MSDLKPDLGPAIVEAIAANAEEAAAALGRAFEGDFVVRAGDPTPLSKLGADLSGGGLLGRFVYGDTYAAVALPLSSGLLPDWVREPDPTGESKLSTLGQELSMLLMPEELLADEFPLGWVDDLAAALERGAASDDTMAIAIELAAGEKLGTMTLSWPLAAAAVDSADAASKGEDTAPAESTDTPDTPASAEAASPVRYVRDFRDLPANALSLLQVSVPVSVSLAEKKVAIEEVVELGPGSIITFDKSCDAPVVVSVGDRPIADGAAVKVGEKFGVRVREMILPEERFKPMIPTQRRQA